MNPPRTPVSAFIICLNEERNIARCLESVSWCDEIVVVDSGSTDRTREICEAHGVRFIAHPWEGFVKQKRFALGQCKHEWCLNLDADEEVSPELRDEILRSLPVAEENHIAGFELSRVVFHLGRWWRRGGWYPEHRLRLVRRSRTTWGGEDPHERAEVEGPTVRLAGELRHYTYTSIADQMETLNRFSTIAAASMHARGRRATILNIIFNPCGRFLKFYLIRHGFLEGFPGFVVAAMEGYYVFLKYVKLYERERLLKEAL